MMGLVAAEILSSMECLKYATIGESVDAPAKLEIFDYDLALE